MNLFNTMLYLLWGSEKSIFPQPIWTKFGIRGQVKGSQRSGNLWRKNGGWDEFRRAQVFLCGNPEDLSATLTADFHQIWPQNVIQCFVNRSGKTFSKMFTLGVICPQNLKSNVGQTGTSLLLLVCVSLAITGQPRNSVFIRRV